MAVIDTNHYVDLIDADDPTGPILQAPGYTAESSDPLVASIGVGADGSSIAVVGQSDGPFTVTVTRVSDGATGSVSGEVGVMGGSFNVAFGPTHLKG